MNLQFLKADLAFSGRLFLGKLTAHGQPDEEGGCYGQDRYQQDEDPAKPGDQNREQWGTARLTRKMAIREGRGPGRATP